MQRLLLAVGLVLGIFVGSVDAVGNCGVFRTWNSGDSLTSGDLNSSFTTAATTNSTPQCVDDYSADATQMKANTNPGAVGSESLATTLAGELERIRYVLKTGFGWSQWYTLTNFDLGSKNLTTTGTLGGASLTLTTPLPVTSGGIGVATLATGGALYGAGTGAVAATAIGAANSVLTHNGTVPAFSATPTVTSLVTTGTLTVGSGTAMSKVLSATASLDFTALAANACEVLTIAVTGAVDGDVVALGVPTALADVDGATERTVFFGWVSASDVISVRRCNVTAATTAEPAAATVRATVIRH